MGAYPPTEEQMQTMRDIGTFPGPFDFLGMPSIKATVVGTKDCKKPFPIYFMPAGMVYFPGEALYDVPFDPYLAFLFFGEEILFSARLWTSGYNLYAPVRHFCVHHYMRTGKPRFTEDNPGSDAGPQQSQAARQVHPGLHQPQGRAP